MDQNYKSGPYINLNTRTNKYKTKENNEMNRLKLSVKKNKRKEGRWENDNLRGSRINGDRKFLAEGPRQK